MEKLKAVQKRDLLVKEVLAPLLKEAGFYKKRMNWWKELEDGYLFISMQNNRFNSEASGCSFWFYFSASYKNEIRDKLENQWIANQLGSISEHDFLPHGGMLAPNRDGMGYRIDGYRNWQPYDLPIEEIFEQVKKDFEVYIMPQLMLINDVKAFRELKDTLRKKEITKEDKLIKYYGLVHTFSCCDDNLPFAVEIQNDLGLTAEDIRSRYDLLDIITQNSCYSEMDAKPFIEKSLKVEEQA